MKVSENIFFQKIKETFTPVSKNYKDEFYRRISKENLSRIIIISIIYILFEIAIILTRKEIMDVEFEIKRLLIVITFYIIAILISFWLIFKKKPVKGIITQVIVALYCVVLVYWSVIISIDQVSRTGSITMFILTLTTTSVLFYKRTLVTVITNFGFYIYFVLCIKLLAKSPIINNPAGNIPPRNHPIENFSPGNHPVGNFPPVRNPIGSILPDVNIYIVDALLMTLICSVLGIIVYRLRLKIFLEQKAFEELALKDSMTNLLNHKTICSALENEIKRSKRYSQPVSILMTDIDHFKTINDTYGHQVGDQVIIKIAKLLTEICRETDYVGRYGGEEFLVVLVNTNEDGAKIFSERLRKEIEKIDFDIPSQVTVSGGVKAYKSESAEEMIKHADEALYQAKEQGRNCIVSAGVYAK